MIVATVNPDGIVTHVVQASSPDTLPYDAVPGSIAVVVPPIQDGYVWVGCKYDFARGIFVGDDTTKTVTTGQF